MTTIKDAATSLRESLKVEDALRKLAPHVQLHKNGVERCGPCPRCGGDDRFYVTQDGKYCACRQCHTQRMDVVGLVAWYLRVPMHEATDVLNGRSRVDPRREPFSCASVSQPAEAETSTQTATWRADAAQKVEEAHKRLLSATETAATARDYLLSRGLTPDTWEAFTLGYDRARIPVDGGAYVPAICWPVTHETNGETVAVRYRFLETHAGKRYTSLGGSRTVGRLFGTQLLWADVVARWRCLVITEGEFNAMSVYQCCNDAGIDVLSFGSESQRTLPAWAVDVASRYGAVVTWLDSPEKSIEVSRQLPGAVALRSLHSETGLKLDANARLADGALGGLIQKARLHALPVELHEAVLWDLWEAWRDGVLDAGQVRVGRELAQTLGHCAAWT